MPTLNPSRRKLADKSRVWVFFPAWSIPSKAMRREGKRESKPFGLLITLSNRERSYSTIRAITEGNGPAETSYLKSS
jgi:hypothetical protein